MRPRRGETCSDADAGRACLERWEAVAGGRFFWQDFVGWIWLDSCDPHTPWDFCPWCGETLPDLAEEDDLLDEMRQADGAWDGEDGG
jgi:hypothetical protein